MRALTPRASLLLHDEAASGTRSFNVICSRAIRVVRSMRYSGSRAFCPVSADRILPCQCRPVVVDQMFRERVEAEAVEPRCQLRPRSTASSLSQVRAASTLKQTAKVRRGYGHLPVRSRKSARSARSRVSRKSECPTETPDHVSGQPRSVLSRPSREKGPAEMSR